MDSNINENFPEQFNNHPIMAQAENLIKKFNLNQDIICDKKCQENQRIDKLYQKYLTARENVKSAPEKLEQAEAEFYKQDKGIDWYNKYKHQKESKRSDELGEYLTDQFDIQKNNLQLKLNTFDAQNDYTDNLGDLLDSYKSRMSTTQNNLDDAINTMNRSNRLSYYTEENLSRWKAWNKFFIILFWLLFAAYFIVIIIIDKNYKNKHYWLVVFWFIVYYIFLKYLIPYLIRYIHAFLKPIEATKVGNYPNTKNYSSQ